MNLLDLPLEIRHRIAEFLPLCDCHSLAVTHSSLREVAESQIWRTVDILQDWGRPRFGGNPTDDGVGSEEVELDVVSALYTRRLREVQPGVTQSRAKHVSTFRVAVGTDVRVSLPELFALIQPSVRTLALTAAYNIYLECDLLEPIRQLGAFQRVTSLTFTLQRKWASTLTSIHTLFPNLDSLRLEGSATQYWHKETDRPDYTMGQIKHLELVQMGRDTKYFLPPLLAVINGVRRLGLTTRGEWISADEVLGGLPVDLISALREYKGLEHFVYGLDERLGAIDHVGHIDELFDGSGWEDLRTVTIGGGIEMESETYIENIHLPNVPLVTTVNVACRNCYWSARVKTDLGKAPPPRQMIAATTFQQLRDCASLLRVIFSIHERDPPLDPQEWCSERVSGVLIREYTNGEETFFHLRRMELTKSTPKVYTPDPSPPPRCTGGKCHKWVDHTRYRGYRVTDGTLDKVYKVIQGEGKGWTTPGRGLEMPEKVWRHLQRGLRQAMRM